MHSDEIRKALFPMEVRVDELWAEKEALKKQLDYYSVETLRYRMLKEMGVVITLEGQGAVYLQGEEMDEWFNKRPEWVGFPDAEVHAEGQAVNYNTKPRKKK